MTPERIALLSEITGTGPARNRSDRREGSAGIDRPRARLQGDELSLRPARRGNGGRHPQGRGRDSRCRHGVHAAAARRPYDATVYDASLSIIDNVIFGLVATRNVNARGRVFEAVRAVLKAGGQWDTVFEAGLLFSMGSGGRGLSEAQRQKLRLARVLVKKPDMLILNRACSILPRNEQRSCSTRCSAVRAGGRGAPGVICLPSDPENAAMFDRVILFEDGQSRRRRPAGRSLASDATAAIWQMCRKEQARGTAMVASEFGSGNDAGSIGSDAAMLRAVPFLARWNCPTSSCSPMSQSVWTSISGDVVFEQDSSGKDVYFVLDGKADVLAETERGPVLIATLPRHALFGEISAFCDVPRLGKRPGERRPQRLADPAGGIPGPHRGIAGAGAQGCARARFPAVQDHAELAASSPADLAISRRSTSRRGRTSA